MNREEAIKEIRKQYEIAEFAIAKTNEYLKSPALLTDENIENIKKQLKDIKFEMNMYYKPNFNKDEMNALFEYMEQINEAAMYVEGFISDLETYKNLNDIENINDEEAASLSSIADYINEAIKNTSLSAERKEYRDIILSNILPAKEEKTYQEITPIEKLMDPKNNIYNFIASYITMQNAAIELDNIKTDFGPNNIPYDNGSFYMLEKATKTIIEHFENIESIMPEIKNIIKAANILINGHDEKETDELTTLRNAALDILEKYENDKNFLIDKMEYGKEIMNLYYGEKLEENLFIFEEDYEIEDLDETANNLLNAISEFENENGIANTKFGRTVLDAAIATWEDELRKSYKEFQDSWEEIKDVPLNSQGEININRVKAAERVMEAIDTAYNTYFKYGNDEKSYGEIVSELKRANFGNFKNLRDQIKHEQEQSYSRE